MAIEASGGGAQSAPRRGAGLPAGPPDLANRFSAALVALVDQRGYEDVSSADLARHAGVEPEEFHRRFAGKGECFAKIHEAAIADLDNRMSDALATATGGWPDRAAAGIAALLDRVAEDPALARMCLVTTLGSGPAARTRYEETVECFLPFLRRLRSVSSRGGMLPEVTEEAIAGGLLWRLHGTVLDRGAERIPDLLPELISFVLTPYFGSIEAAVAAARARDRSCSSQREEGA